MTEEPRELPNARGVEKAVLSVIMQEPDRFDEISALTDAHFYNPANRVVFGTIKAVMTEGKQLELVTFVERLKGNGLLETAGGAAEVASLYGFSMTGVNLKQHCEMLNEALARRIAIDRGAALVESAYNEEIEEVSNQADKAATEIETTLTSAAEAKTLKTILKESFDRFQDRATGKSDAVGIPTIDLIDRHLRGLHGGRLWVIGAYPSGGVQSPQ